LADAQPPLETIRKEAENMEFQAARFYDKAAERTTDVGVRTLFGDLAAAERGHESRAAELEAKLLTPSARTEEEKTQRRMFVLQYVQPGLAGLMDGIASPASPGAPASLPALTRPNPAPAKMLFDDRHNSRLLLDLVPLKCPYRRIEKRVRAHPRKATSMSNSAAVRTERMISPPFMGLRGLVLLGRGQRS
jgi:rubrerythrin